MFQNHENSCHILMKSYTFEHEEHLRELILKQQDINRSLDLDKSDTQAAVDAPSHEERNDDTVNETLPARRGTFEQIAEEGQPTLRRTAVESYGG